MDPVVETKGLSRTFGEVTALHDVTLTIDEGEIFALIGPNGAGKTTFVRTITGALPPTSGRVSLFGGPPRGRSDARIGLLPQAFTPPERLTGREIIAYYAGLYEDARRVEDVLADVGMADAGNRWFERLSGGQQRRICVGTALVNDPEFLILDEPTTGIDPAGRRRLWSLLAELQAAGRTVLLTTHDMVEAETLGDRVGLIDRGELIAVGSPAELTDRHGGTGTVVVEPTAASVAAIDDALSYPVSERGGTARIERVDADQIGSVITALESAGVKYRRVAWEAPSLEDVFFALTERGEAS